jgi:acyl-coenzyme A thioesterase PaaI-like protein
MREPSTLPTPADVNAMVRQGFPGSTNECVELGPGWALARVVPTEANIRPGGFISGPTQFAIADGVLWYAVFAAIGRIEPMALTSELSIRYLRPCVGATLWGRATIDRAGRRSIVGTVRVWTDDNEATPCSVAQGSYALPAHPG